jgi:hypothetical protein
VILAAGFRELNVCDFPGWVAPDRSGIWLADVPPLSIVEPMNPKAEAWIAVDVTQEEYDAHFASREYPSKTWPARQWLLPAAVANQFPRRKVPLVEVLKLRLDRSCPYRVSHADLETLIRTGMRSPLVQKRWLTALHEARRAS